MGPPESELCLAFFRGEVLSQNPLAGSWWCTLGYSIDIPDSTSTGLSSVWVTIPPWTSVDMVTTREHFLYPPPALLFPDPRMGEFPGPTPPAAFPFFPPFPPFPPLALAALALAALDLEFFFRALALGASGRSTPL